MKKPVTRHESRVTGNSVAIYTVITNNYDTLKSHHYRIRQGIDFICFTDDKNLRHPEWKIIYLDESELPDYDPKLTQRKIKILGHPALHKYKHVAYVDGCMRIRRNLRSLIIENSDKPTFFKNLNFKDSFRASEHVIRIKKAPEDPQRQQIDYLRKTYGEETFMSQHWTGFMIRDSDNNSPIWEAWWKLFEMFPFRDQIPLPAALLEGDHRVLENKVMMLQMIIGKHNEGKAIYYD